MNETSDRFRRFSHGYRRYNAPISEPRLRAIIERLEAEPDHAIVDIGCGTGEWLLQLVAASQASGVGVDTDALGLDEAERRALDKQLTGRVRWALTDAKDHAKQRPRAYDRALCVGSSHAFGGFAGTLEAARELLRPGGRLLVGEGFWHEPPPADYVELLGGDNLVGHADNVAQAESLGYDVLWATTANLDEWDEFEWAFYRVAVEYARDHPGDEGTALVAERRRWRDGYLKWGRGTMGFGYYVLATG